MPANMIIPIKAVTPKDFLVMKRPKSPPPNANGIVNIMINGLIKDSNCAAITI